MYFNQDTIKAIALPAIIELAQDEVDQATIKYYQFEQNNLLVSLKKNDESCFLALNNIRQLEKLGFHCSCDYNAGGACQHIVTAMLQIMEQDQIIGDSPTIDTVTFPVSKKVIPDKPRFRLYLSEFDTLLIIEPRFVYTLDDPGCKQIEFKRDDQQNSTIIPSRQGTFYQIVRSKARENALVEQLNHLHLIHYQRGFFTPKCDPCWWIKDILPQCESKDWEIFGQKKLVFCKIRNPDPQLNIEVSKGKTGFLCSFALDFSGVPASLSSLLKAIHANKNFVRLEDGSWGFLPPAFLTSLTRFFSLAKPQVTQNGFSLTTFHGPLLQALNTMNSPDNITFNLPPECDPIQSFKEVKKIGQPPGFKGKMRSYQIAGLEWFYFLQKFTFGGCLADDMGLGKTIQILALLMHEKNTKPRTLPSLILAPKTVLFNWEREIRKFVPSLISALYYGPSRRQMKDTLACADVILTTYGILTNDLNSFTEMSFHYLILDESQIIKNPGARITRSVGKLNARYKLALSGTPIENNLKELWSLFSFINPNLFGSLANFNKNFMTPIEKEQDREAVQVLQKMTYPFILRRTKKQVIKELPEKTEIIVSIEMVKAQKALYNITKEFYLSLILDAAEKKHLEHTGIQIIEGMLRLRQICCHPRIVDKNYQGDSGKFQALDDFLELILANNHRVLMFSQFETMLKLVQQRLHHHHIHNILLTGKTGDRAAVVDRFQKNLNIPVFLISLKAGGLGLNLTQADLVIHLDPWWNPAVENQATDRAYRMGQKKEVFVYKFITRQSIEERVLLLQKRKKDLIKSIIPTEDSFYKNLSLDDIKFLFS